MLDPTVDTSAIQPADSNAPSFNPLAFLKGPNFVNPAYSTPEQRAALYAYSKALMNPQPIKNGWQGLAEIARSLIGGYEGYRADQMAQASRAYDASLAGATAGQAFSPGASGAAPLPTQTGAPSAATPLPNTPPAGSTPAKSSSNDASSPGRSQVLAYAADSAARHGIDPKVGAAFVNGEMGSSVATPGDDNSSFGPMQLHYGGVSKQFPNPGMGDAFTAATGKDARDPSTWRDQIDFGMAQAAAHGWSPWATTRDKLGLSNYAGISPQGSSAPAAAAINAVAPAPSVSPATHAMGAALAGGAGSNAPPIRMAQNNAMPIPGAAIGEFLADPNIPVEVKHQIMETIAPRTMTDATGNVYISHQNQPPQGGPIFQGGVRGGEVSPGVPTIITGTPANPRNVIVAPGVAGQGGPAASSPANPPVAGASSAQPKSPTPNVLGPGSVVGDLNAQKAETEAHAKAIGTAGDVSSQQYSNDLVAAANFPRTSLPLTKAIPLLDQLGQTGTGPGTDTWNHAMSFFQSMGIPISDPNNIKAFDEVKKYLTDNVNQTGDRSTNDKLAASFAGNPSVEVSNAAASDVAKTTLAMQRFKQAQILSYANQPNHAPEGYSQYAKDFSSQYDPRAFGIDLMSPAARKALFATLAKKPDANGNETNQERIKFLKSLKIAQDTGMIPAPPSGQ